jgi:MFS family permease
VRLMREQSTTERRARLAGIPHGVWLLGLVSLCMDLSSELIHALLPLYLSVSLGASMLAIGVIEGIAESTAMIVKVFSGVLSDLFRRRKPLTVLGYGLSALTKPIFPLATTLDWIVGARFVDRVGKGIRGAPRDALIADLTPAEVRGASFGLRQTLDTVGAVGGPLAAIGAMAWLADDFRRAFWVAVVPALISVAVLLFGVSEPPSPASDGDGKKKLQWRDVRRLPRRYWTVVAIAAVFTLARFSEAFLILRAHDVGLTPGNSPWVMVVMSIVYAISSYPAGAAADRGHGGQLLSAGLLALIAADVLLAAAGGAGLVLVGAGIWGLHMGLTQGLLAALVAATAPADLRGSAFGVFNLASGIALFVASGLAGWLWGALGASATFGAGAAFTLIAWLGLLRYGRGAGSLGAS